MTSSIPERFRPWFRASNPGDVDLLAPCLDPDECREIRELSRYPDPATALRGSYDTSYPHFRFTLWDDDALPGLPLAMGGLCPACVLWILRRGDALAVSRTARRFFAGPDAFAVLDWWGSLAPDVPYFQNRTGVWNTRTHRWLERLGAVFPPTDSPRHLWFFLPNPRYVPETKTEGGRHV
ncbi:MAG: hypothetical protein K2O70_05105 [Desulfovibrionaceae bacterium]|nr:hypothetical protein [Desulfovibrionaceae bacterium]